MTAQEAPLENIVNVKMSASSEYNWQHGAWRARLNLKNGNGGVGSWVSTAAEMAKDPWVQADFGKPVAADGVVTQGRDGVGHWTKTYEVHYGNSPNGMKSVGKTFNGNVDYWQPIYNSFGKRITARYWRIVSKSYHGYPSIRFDVWKNCE
jgi:hypothetical protein